MKLPPFKVTEFVKYIWVDFWWKPKPEPTPEQKDAEKERALRRMREKLARARKVAEQGKAFRSFQPIVNTRHKALNE